MVLTLRLFFSAWYAESSSFQFSSSALRFDLTALFFSMTALGSFVLGSVAKSYRVYEMKCDAHKKKKKKTENRHRTEQDKEDRLKSEVWFEDTCIEGLRYSTPFYARFDV